MQLYLGKGNRCDPMRVNTIRICAQKLFSGSPHKLVEFTGGEYSNKPLKNSDKLILMGDTFKIDGDSIIRARVGKGIYQQFHDFYLSPGKCYDDVIFIDTTTHAIFSIYDRKEVGKMSQNWTDNYGTFFLTKLNVTYEEKIMEWFNVEYSIECSNESELLLLI